MSLLLRLEHIFEKNEDPVLSKSVTVNLKKLFASFELSSIRETTLGANQWLSENDKLTFNVDSTLEDVAKNQTLGEEAQETLWENGWKTWIDNQCETNDIDNPLEKMHGDQQSGTNIMDEFQVTLEPMQIRTFIVEIKRY